MTDSVFWKISRPESPEHYSLVFGTIHLYIDEFEPIVVKATENMRRFKYFFAESNLDLIKELRMPLVDSKEVQTHLTKSQQARIQSALKKYIKLDWCNVSALRPLFIIALIQRTLLSERVKDKSIDELLWQKAASFEMICSGIETAEEQSRYLDHMPLEDEYHELFKISTHISKSRKKLVDMLSMYEQEQVQTIYRMTRESLGKNRKLMIIQRNQLLAKRIILQHDQNEAFFCFGAGHLSGKYGVLRFLKQRGFEIKAM